MLLTVGMRCRADHKSGTARWPQLPGSEEVIAQYIHSSFTVTFALATGVNKAHPLITTQVHRQC